MALSGKGLWLTALCFIVVTGQIAVQPDIQPEFLAPLQNTTVTQGRDVHFTCIVNHLTEYKVAWIKSDSKAILAIHTHMVALNPRLSVTYNGHNTWKLHVANVQANDSGTYMCQINTDPMRSIMGSLQVVIPPDILNEEEGGGGEGVALEGGSIRLRCEATGRPPPTVVWKREGGRNIVFRHDAAREKKAVSSYEGPILHLSNVQRSDMGSYFCIASNGVPPSVSKRYNVQIQFHPLIKVSNQLVAAPLDSDVTVQCYVEASPKAMNSWYKENGEKLLDSTKYIMNETPINEYSLFMNLTINKLERKDFGGYACSSVNALGRVEGSVRLQELVLPSRPSSTHTTKTQDNKKNHIKHDNKHKNNNNNRGRKQEHGRGKHELSTRSWMDSRTPDEFDIWGSRPPWQDLISSQMPMSHRYQVVYCLFTSILVSLIQFIRFRLSY